MSITGMGLVWRLREEENLEVVRDYGVRAEMLRGPARDAYEYLVKHYREHGVMPSRETILYEVDPEDAFDYEPDEPCSYYAKSVVRRAALQAQRELIRDIGDAVQDRDPEKVHAVAKEILRAGSRDYLLGTGTVTNAKYTRKERWELFLEAEEAEEGIQGVRSPWETLDKETGGQMPEDLLTIVARLGTGKTWAAILFAIAAEKQGKTVGFISMEMSKKAVERRRDALLYLLPYFDFKRGELDHEARARYQEAMEAPPSEEDPDWFIAAGGRVRDISDAEIFVEETGCDVLIIDGVYLMQSDNPRMPRHERIEEAIRGTKRLAQRKKISVVVTAQFNREVRANALRGEAGSIGGSDAIGQDSDVVLGMFQDETMRNSRQMLIQSLKVREGRPVEIPISWDFTSMNFNEMAVSDSPEGPAEPFEDTLF